MGFRPIIHSNATLTTHNNKHDFYYRNSCTVCPFRLDRKVEPHGSTTPIVYILGEAPGREEIRDGRPFVGASGEMLRKHIPRQWYDDQLLRWNNCLKARPPDNRTPTAVELACCRSLLENDIVATEPVAIFGFGAVPLSWAGLADTGILTWAGRYTPLLVRNQAGQEHACWYFPITHPSYVLHKLQEAYGEPRLGYTSEDEFAFHVHLKNAFALVDDIESLGAPVVHTRDMAMEGIEVVDRFDDSALQRVLRFIDSMYSEKVVGFDYETNALRPYNRDTRILTASLSGARGTLAWPVDHRESKWTKDQLVQLDTALHTFIEKAPCIKAVHNAAFEMEWAAVHHGKQNLRTDTWACTMSQAYVLDERQSRGSGPGPQSLDWLTRQYFGFSIKSLSSINRANLDSAPLSDVLPYNGCDAKYHRKLFLKQRSRITREGLGEVYKQHMRRVRAAVLTQVRGLPVNHIMSDKLYAKYTAAREQVEARIEANEAAKDYKVRKGNALSPSATRDVAWMIDHVLPEQATNKVPRDEDGKIKTVDEATLKLVKHPIAPLLIEWRKANKVLSTYIKPLMAGSAHVYDDGLLHPQTRTTTVVTWRTSTDDPNYQNFPKRDGERREVRAQIAKLAAAMGHNPRKYKVVSFDYASIQARNVAMESKDPALVKAFRDRYDIHTDWMEQIIRLEPRWIKEGVKELAHNKTLAKAYRNRAKNEFVFPSIFGAKPTTTAYYLGVDDRIGIKAQELFWERFNGVLKWHEHLLRFYREHGYVTGLSGWRRRAPIAPNELINTPIQSDEAAIVCDAMCRLSETGVWPLQPNMEIHDDLTFVWREEDVDRYARAALDVMLNCPFEWSHIVPLGVEMNIGDDWYKQSTVGEYFTDTWKGKL